jgi:YhcH/YjgK/YiaL family protein
MIIGSLGESRYYENIHPLFKQAFDYLKSVDFLKVEPGKYELAGTDLFAIVSDTTLKHAEDARLEVHNAYIDIQLPVSKTERFGWASRSTMNTPLGVFDDEKDIQFFDDEKSMIFPLQQGCFAVFFPDDAHAPCIGEGIVRKVVVKIKL